MNAMTETIVSDQQSPLFFTLAADGDPASGLVVRGFKAFEGLSRLYEIELDLASRRDDIDLASLVDKPARLTIDDRYGQPRYFHGLVERAEKGDTGNPDERGMTWTFYRLTLMPALHRLRYASDCRVFQALTVPQIVETILSENGVRDFVFHLTEVHAQREYNVQYRETMLGYVERLMAEEGIYYTHVHEEGRHVLVMSDRSIAAADCANASSVDYNANPGGDVRGPWIKRFSWREIVRPSTAELNDYTFKAPAARMIADQNAAAPGLTRSLQIYDYPGRYKAVDVGQNFTRWQIESLRADASCGEGQGRCQYLTAGGRFTLAGHPDASLDRRYLLVEVLHEGRQPQALEEAAGDGGMFLATSFAVIDGMTPWRPSRRMRPIADGPEIARVVGPTGEEIYTDPYSRIKVQFPWDRYGQFDDRSSCWIRVAQAWGGPTYGNIAIPRIGHEVIVSFLNGDPDQPIVTGRAYHATNLPPYALPDNKTKMVIRSQTHKGPGYNEFSMEDENGAQNIFMLAQKDHTVQINNNQTSNVGANAMHTVGQNQSLQVGANMQHNVGGGLSIAVGGVGGAVAGLAAGAAGLASGSSAMMASAMGMAAGASSGGAANSAGGDSSGGAPTSAGAAAGALGAAAGAAAAPAGPASPSATDALMSALTTPSAYSLATAGGADMAAGGASMAATVAGLIGPGIMNTTVDLMQTNTVGVAKTETIGVADVLNVGVVAMENIGMAKVETIGMTYAQTVGQTSTINVGQTMTVNVGQTMTIAVGQELTISVGASQLIMDSAGNVTILGTKFNFLSSGPVQVAGTVIDHN